MRFFPYQRGDDVTQSMTGFSRVSVATDSALVTVEMRSVNNRYLDVQFRAPETLRALEPVWRDRIAKRIARGKIDVFVKPQAVDNSAPLHLDQARLTALQDALTDIGERFPEAAFPDRLALLMAPGVLNAEIVEESTWINVGHEAMQKALDELEAQRLEEGKKLENMIRSRVGDFGGQLCHFRGLLPELRAAQRQRILDRLTDLKAEPDARRLEEELVYSAQKADVDEELDRLEAHLQAISAALDGTQPCGRRLDFLMQELNREANTLSSKSTALITTETAVEFKVLIEQMREQIQNIE